jgi:hypothetical protein
VVRDIAPPLMADFAATRIAPGARGRLTEHP